MGEDNDEERQRFAELDSKLDAARKRQAETQLPRARIAGDVNRSALSLAFRIGIELVAALAVSVLLGLALDRWLGTLPLFLVLFFGLGAAAGVLNVYRAVSGIGYDPNYGRYRREGEETEAGDEDERADRG